MNSNQPQLVPLKQVVYVVDTVRLASDGAQVGRDSHAAHVLNTAGIRHSFFPTDKAGAAASFGAEELFLLVLGERRRGQIRDFRFVADEDKPMNIIDDGDVFAVPESLDDDEMLVFECRSKKHLMKWFFHCLPEEKSRARLNGAPVATVASTPPGQTSSVKQGQVTISVPREVESASLANGSGQPKIPSPVAPAEKTNTSTSAVVPASAVTVKLSQEKGKVSMKSYDSKPLLQHLIKEFCTALDVTVSAVETGNRGEGDVLTRVRRATVYVAKLLEVPTNDVSDIKGMPTPQNLYKVLNKANEDYGDGKTPFAKMVDLVAGSIPKKLLPPESSESSKSGDQSDAGPTKAAAEKSTSRAKKRRPYKKRAQKTAVVPQAEERPLRPATSPRGQKKGEVNLDQDLLIFLFWKTGVTAVELSAKFDVGIGDIHRAVGRFTMANAHGDPEVVELVRLVDKIQARSSE